MLHWKKELSAIYNFLLMLAESKVWCKNNELSVFSKCMKTWGLFHDEMRITNHNMFRYSNDHSRLWSYKRKYATPVRRVLISPNSYVHI